jgi:hypothetical protein
MVMVLSSAVKENESVACVALRFSSVAKPKQVIASDDV